MTTTLSVRITTNVKRRLEARGVAHEDVSKWLRSWGKKRERKAPRA